MHLKVIGSGSRGNCYVLTASNGRSLIIEAGVNFKNVKQAIDFDVDSVDGVLVTHSHGDHAKYVIDFLNSGLNIYMSAETKKEVACIHHRVKEITATHTLKLGDWTILPFDVKHDVKCLGFLLYHPECGKTLFLTDSIYSPYTFNGLNNIIIEANYCKEIIDQKFGPESGKEFLRNRILRSHFSLQNCKDMLAANDLSKVNNIVLIHLSDSNSHEGRFQSEVAAQTCKNVTVASNGMTIPFNRTPF